MKNEKIMEAMDSFTPTYDQRARMRDNLERTLEKKARSPRRHESPRVYTRRYEPPKYSFWKGVLTALLAVVVLSGSFLALANGALEDRPSATKSWPTARETLQTNPGPLRQPYYEVLETYRRAYEGKWSLDECRNADVNEGILNLESIDQLGYALLDLNYDGIDELLITGPEEHYMYDVNGIYGIFTLNDQGKAVHVEGFSGLGAAVEVLCHDRSVLFPRQPNPKSEEDRAFDYYRLDGEMLVKTDTVYYAPGINAENPWLRYYLGSNHQIGERVPITQEEFESVLNFRKPAAFTYYSVAEATNVEIQEAEDYQTILDRYRRQYVNDGQCRAAQVSNMILDVGHKAELAYCLRDVDGDGQEDLLITNADGSSIHCVYIQKDGKVEMHPLFQYWETDQKRPRTLMEDNTLMETVGKTDFIYNRLDDYSLFSIYKDNTQQWHIAESYMSFVEEFLSSKPIPETIGLGDYDPTQNEKAHYRDIPEEEAQKIIASYTPAQLEVHQLPIPIEKLG